jgi:hypothetical protein
MRERVREATVGNATLRLFKEKGRFRGAVIVGKNMNVHEGDNADAVWREMHDAVGRANPKYFGFEGARKRFAQFFPQGFEDADYFHQERDYKVVAKTTLEASVPVEKAAAGGGFAEPVLAAFQTNLISPFEKMRLREALRGPNADAFVRAAARFALGEGKSALLDMDRALKPHDSAKWTVVTYLPFLWRPSSHMFLKPAATKDFAERVGHRFANDYEARLDIAVYDSLLDLASMTMKEIEELKPRDRIDVQSFIWVVGNYDPQTDAPSPGNT